MSERNIGVAIEIPEPFGQTLVDKRRAVGDLQAEKVPAHVTLLPPTAIEDADLPAVCDHLEKAATSLSDFTMILRGTGTFRPVSEVVFVVVAAGIAECELLESRVRSEILYQDLRFNYHPHVTIAHDVPTAALDRAFEDLAQFEARFVVDSFFLYTCGKDGVWRKEREFKLGVSAAN